MSAADELDALLADLEERVQAIRNFQCLHGLERTATRRLARRMIGLAKHWRSEIAARPGTLLDTVVATATAPRVGSADTGSPPSVDRSNECQRVQR